VEVAVVRATIFYDRKQKIFTALNISRQYPLILLVKVVWRKGKAMGSGFCDEQ
jgi:hypothetical protein